MKARLTYPLLVLAALLLLCGPGGAIPTSLQGKFHKEKELKILVLDSRRLRDVEKLRKSPASVKIAVIQAKPEEMKEAAVSTIMTWVRGGGTIWFYDSRMAPLFGMENCPLRKTDELKFKPVEDEFGSFKKTKGAACTASAVGRHPVNTGVQGVTVFLLEIDRNTFSAVKETAGTTALLKVIIDQPIAVAALRREGKGLVVFKPLLWPESLTGDRFQANLLEYSAGYPVPEAEPETQAAPDETPVTTPSPTPASTPTAPPASPTPAATPTAAPSPAASPAASPTPAATPTAAPSPAASPAASPTPAATPTAAPSPAASPAASPTAAPGGEKPDAKNPKGKRDKGPRYDLVILRDRQEIKGKILNEFFRLDMVNKVPAKDVKKVEFGESGSLDVLVLKSGMTLQGYLPESDTIDVRMLNKRGVSLQKRSVREIIFDAGSDAGK